MSLKTKPVLSRLIGCKPEARFILEATARDSSLGRDEDQYIRSKLLAKQLRMVEGTVTAALGELVTAGLVERIESTTSGKGRPRVSYQIAPQPLVLIADQQSTLPVHSEHLQRLFSRADIPTEILSSEPKPRKERAVVNKNGTPAPPGARGRLSLCNRLLLGALLANADQFGVVAGLSNLKLRQLTGLDSESLSHRLKRLREVGFIRSYVPGVTSSVFRTKKISSTYFLNLNHPGYGLNAVGAVLVHRHSFHEIQNDVCNDLWSNVCKFRGPYPPQSPLKTPKPVLEFLRHVTRPAFNVLRLMLYRHVCELLSRHGYGLLGGSAENYEWLRDRIDADLQPPAGHEDGDGQAKGKRGDVGADPEIPWQPIISYFCELVVDIAKMYRVRFGATKWTGFDQVQFCILPVLECEEDEVITLLLQPRPQKASIYTVFHGYPGPGVKRQKWEAETDVPLEDRFNFGLLTRPA